MPRKCPVCGTRFPDDANVCDQHGVALVAVAPSRRRLLYMAAGLASAAALLGPFAIRQYVASQIAVNISNVRIVKPKSAASDRTDLNRWLAGKSMSGRLTLHNGSRLPLEVDAAGYEVIVSSVQAVAGSASIPIRIGPGESRDLEWMLPLQDAALRNALLHPPAEGIQAEIRATVQFRLLGLPCQAPYRQQVRIRPVLNL